MKKIDIHIEGVLGSKFQEQVWGELLEETIIELLKNITNYHKKNKFTVNGKEI